MKSAAVFAVLFLALATTLAQIPPNPVYQILSQNTGQYVTEDLANGAVTATGTSLPDSYDHWRSIYHQESTYRFVNNAQQQDHLVLAVAGDGSTKLLGHDLNQPLPGYTLYEDWIEEHDGTFVMFKVSVGSLDCYMAFDSSGDLVANPCQVTSAETSTKLFLIKDPSK